MTPLPGSKDHQKYYEDKVPMETDTNRFDTMHVCMKHPKMTDEELMRAYWDSWHSFYNLDHMDTILKRLKSRGLQKRTTASLIWFCSSIFSEKVHPLLGGFIRMKGRKNRRPGFPRENFLIYYLRRAFELAGSVVGLAYWAIRLYRLKIKSGKPENANYSDAAITPAAK
jgi:hypothetical protein